MYEIYLFKENGGWVAEIPTHGGFCSRRFERGTPQEALRALADDIENILKEDEQNED